MGNATNSDYLANAFSTVSPAKLKCIQWVWALMVGEDKELDDAVGLVAPLPGGGQADVGLVELDQILGEVLRLVDALAWA